MRAEDVPLASPDGAALLFVLGRLIVLLDRYGGPSIETVAADLEMYADSVPDDARPLVQSLARSLRRPVIGIVPGGASFQK